MAKQNTESLCATVRKQYGDTVEEFAVRLGTTASTIRRWEKLTTPGKTVGHALLLAAQKGNFPATPPRFDKAVENMSEQDVLKLLASGYGDTMQRFACRIGVNYATVQNWTSGTYQFSPAAKRLIRHIMERPSDFADAPAAILRQNAAT